MWLVISQAALTVLVVGVAALVYRFLSNVRRDVLVAQVDIAANQRRIEESISGSLNNSNTIQQTINQLDGRFQSLRDFVKDQAEQESVRWRSALGAHQSEASEKIVALGRSFDDKIIELSREMEATEAEIYKKITTLEGSVKSQTEAEKRAENNRPRSRAWSAHASAASEGALHDTSV